MPKTKPKKNGARFLLNLTPAERDAVKIAAIRKRVSMQRYIREAVRMRLVADGEIEKGKE